MAMDVIRIEGLEVDCVVGVRPDERVNEQRVSIDVGLHLDLAPAGHSGRIADTYDYDRIADELIALLRFRRYQIIENATEELAAMLLGVHPMASRADIRLVKPAALRGRARAAAVEISRTPATLPTQSVSRGFGTQRVLLSSHESELSCVELNPGASLDRLPEAADCTVSRRLMWVVRGQLTAHETNIPRRCPVRSAVDEPMHLTNTGDTVASLFVCRC